MEAFLFISIGFGLFLLFQYGKNFGEQLDELDTNVIFYTGDDVAKYVDQLMCESIKKFPDISAKDKAKLVMTSLRIAAKKNNSFNFLSHLDANYKDFFDQTKSTIKDLQRNKRCINT